MLNPHELAQAISDMETEGEPEIDFVQVIDDNTLEVTFSDETAQKVYLEDLA